MPLKLIILLACLAGLLLIGCRNGETTPTPTFNPTHTTTVAVTTITSPTPTTLPAKTPTATAIPPTATITPEPQPHLSIEDQTLTDDNELLIQELQLLTDSWLVFTDEESGTMVWTTFVTAGIYQDLTIDIDPYRFPLQVTATLHQDEGQTQVFESQEDRPLLIEDEPVAVNFTIERQFSLPTLIISDQSLYEDGLLQIDTVTSPSPSWVIVANADAPEIPLGATFVPAGTNDNVTVQIVWLEAHTELQAQLFVDKGTAGMYEPQIDTPFQIANAPITTTFQVILPPHIFVYDQPVVDDQIIIEQIIMNRPGWVVLYFDNDGALGNIIGSAYLEEGVNNQVTVPVVADAITPLLHARLHTDTGVLETFDFPSEDDLMPFFDQENRRYLPVFSFRTDTNSYLITIDQPIQETIQIPLVVTTSDTWLIIQLDADGEAGEVVGSQLLSAGIHRDLNIPITLDQNPNQLFVTLHADTGELGTFDFPENDPPLEQNDLPVRVPIFIQSN